LLLKNNLKLNGTRNVSTYNVAICDEATAVTVYVHPDKNLGGTTIVPGLAIRGNATLEGSVSGMPITAVLPESVVLNTRLIKIDVEGAPGWRPSCPGSLPERKFLLKPIGMLSAVMAPRSRHSSKFFKMLDSPPTRSIPLMQLNTIFGLARPYRDRYATWISSSVTFCSGGAPD
jgi:hypothetical protein